MVRGVRPSRTAAKTAAAAISQTSKPKPRRAKVTVTKKKNAAGAASKKTKKTVAEETPVSPPGTPPSGDVDSGTIPTHDSSPTKAEIPVQEYTTQPEKEDVPQDADDSGVGAPQGQDEDGQYEDAVSTSSSPPSKVPVVVVKRAALARQPSIPTSKASIKKSVEKPTLEDDAAASLTEASTSDGQDDGEESDFHEKAASESTNKMKKMQQAREKLFAKREPKAKAAPKKKKKTVAAPSVPQSKNKKPRRLQPRRADSKAHQFSDDELSEPQPAAGGSPTTPGSRGSAKRSSSKASPPDDWRAASVMDY